MSTYIGEFQSINRKDYKIKITTSSGNKNETVLLANPPLQVTGSDNDSIYTPIKTTGATVSILTRNLPIDLYSGSVLGTKVEVTSGTSVIWTGYLTPCAYSQNWDKPLEELQLECVDGLSVLKDIPYTSASKEIQNFYQIIFTCLKKANCFKTLYVANTLQLTSSANDSIIEKIRVSEGNFFEEKDYENQPDSEVAWNCYTVLEEICRYLNMSMVAYGNEVYILDYDAIRSGKNSYWKYDISGASIGTKQSVTLSHNYQIKDGSFAETGTKIELSTVYNKIKVKDDFYKIETANEGMDNAKNFTNITAEDDVDLRNALGKTDNGPYVYVDILSPINGVGAVDRLEVITIRTVPRDMGWYFWNEYRFFKNPMI